MLSGQRRTLERPPRIPLGRLGLLFALMLVAYQVLAGAHEVEHLIQGEADHCPICHAAASPALPALPLTVAPLIPLGRTETPALTVADPAVRSRRGRQARAPPD
ncbi:hypothetical protein [Lamprocystis purpurea]|jgi:hypothetical protein|uniref:hypothetical protein n=1 Tax=Lamprocystis purpurea TaxID=61598 RepID=UPI0003806FD3|nr:hypothetical protein [Lamprocystis purpurea]